jgi:predicted dehydrogenase
MTKFDLSGKLNRRNFLITGAGVLAACSIPSWLRAQSRPAGSYRNLVSPDSKLRIACIGIGGKGYSDLHGVADEQIVALCDVDFARASDAFHEFPGAARYRDYRQMFAEMADQIDAVVIATPDHTHFPAAMRALEAGKHIYVQKPLTHTIGEARALREAARRAGVVTQMGNQGHANEGTRLVKEWIDAGALGSVTEIQAWTNRPVWPQGIDWPASAPVPDTLDWNLWQGTAPLADYGEGIVPFNWRNYWNYGCGALGDMGCHLLDAPFWTLNLRGPVRVSAEFEGANTVSAPKWSIVTYEFPARGSLPPLKLTWYDGGKKPPRPPELEADKELPGGGVIYRGDKSVMLVTGDYSNSPRLIPESVMKEFKRPEKTIPRIPKGNPYLEWINACKGGVAPGSNIVDQSADLTEMVLLGNLAIRMGRPIEWDSEKLYCVGLPEADRFINSNYRIF